MLGLRHTANGAIRLPSRGSNGYRPRIAARAAAEMTLPTLSPLGSRDEPERRERPFPYPLPMDPQQKALAGIPLPLFFPALLAFVGAAGGAGMLSGQALPVDPEQKQVAGYAVGALGAAAAGAVAVQAKKKRDSAAVVDLYNSIVELEDPSELTPQIVADVGARYGLNLHKDDPEGLTKIYGQYLESLIPAGDTQLRGDEAAKVSQFKESLGLTDEEAAPVHIEVARRLFRQGYESKDRNLQFEQRKAFQRLLYVSQLVFGDQKAAFLLPWRRHFNITDAQVFVARRDNARAIFRAYLEQQGGKLQADRQFLHGLREQQLRVKLMDETAAELIKDAARSQVEQHLDKAVTALRATAKARDTGAIVSHMGAALEFSRKLARYSNEEDLVPGLGPVSLAGGSWMTDARVRDRKDLYKAYIEHFMERSGEFSPELELDTKDLQDMLVINATTAQGLLDEVAATLYRRMLREEVVSGRLDAAESPAQVLGSLCDKLRFSPEAALELHKSLYKTKMSQLVDGKTTLSESDHQELARIRRILCLPNEVARQAQKDTAGRVLEEAISDIYMLGAKPVMKSDLDRVESIIKGLKIDQDVVMDVFKAVTRDRLKSYVQQALKERGTNGDRKAEAAALKKLVQFNAIVVTPVLEKVKGMDAAAKEIADIMAKAMEQAKAEGAEVPKEGESKALPAPAGEQAAAAAGDSRQEAVKQVQKAMQAARGEFGEEERKGQKEITLRDDVSQENRALLYKDYLMHTMSGEVVELPVGGAIRRKSSTNARSQDMARLQALSELLGMTQMEVAAVHADLSEQAYKAQAQEIMRSGPMTPEKTSYLEDMRSQLGLTKEQGDKLVKQVRTEVYGTTSVAEDGGRWTLDRVLELHKAGGDVTSAVDENVRRNLYRREFERRVSDGSGDLDGAYILKELPSILGLDGRRVGYIAKELVGSRRRLLLVQAVSKLRQKAPSDVVTSLLDLLSCSRAMPDAAPQAWGERSELLEIYSIFCNKVDSEPKRSELASVLGLSAEEAASAAAGTASSSKSAAKDDDMSFF